MTTPLVKRCGCGRTFTAEQWAELPDGKRYTMPWGEEQEQRRCPCGSHLRRGGGGRRLAPAAGPGTRVSVAYGLMYPHAARRQAFGAAINPALLINPAILASFAADPRVAQCKQAGGTWDASSQTCAVGGGIPTWAYLAGGAALAGAAWFFLIR